MIISTAKTESKTKAVASKAPRVELRNISYNARLSEETAAFAAKVYIDGKYAGDASNAGHGGCTRITPPALYDRLTAYAATLPPVASSFSEETFPQDADIVLGDLLEAWIAERDLKRMLRAGSVVAQDGKIFRLTPKLGAEGPAYMAKFHPGGVLLDTLPLPEAIGLFRNPKGAK
jgi:hypothetical protein